MCFEGDFEIFLDSDILRESYLPEMIFARENHIRELERCLSPALDGKKPLSVWLHGSSGTGKTTVALHTLSNLNRTGNVSGAYVN